MSDSVRWLLLGVRDQKNQRKINQSSSLVFLHPLCLTQPYPNPNLTLTLTSPLGFSGGGLDRDVSPGPTFETDTCVALLPKVLGVYKREKELSWKGKYTDLEEQNLKVRPNPNPNPNPNWMAKPQGEGDPSTRMR